MALCPAGRRETFSIGGMSKRIMYIADLHIHSKYSRATSRDCDAPHLELWARYKGLGLIGTGDLTHPAWRQALQEALEPAEEGLYTLKEEARLPESRAFCGQPPRFVVSGEISCIYKRHGRTRKVHNLILLPSLEAADALSGRLEAIGNIRSDGRPILGLDSRDLLEITLSCCPQALFIPAHIWTPHFSMFGAFSGFDSIEECFGDLSGHIRALETGLSSDPPMNWRVSALDGLTLVSHSDAHSPAKLAREADLLEGPMSYPSLYQAITTGAGFLGTLEFFPEEGKYHLDGHRACGVCLSPRETLAYDGRCPICGKKITIGVEHRVEELADRPLGYQPPDAKPFSSLVPLPEIIAASTGLTPASKKVEQAYFSLLQTLGPELYILREAPLQDIQQAAGPLLAEGVRRLRAGLVQRTGGFDGQYGKIALFAPGEREALAGQTSLLAPARLCKAAPTRQGPVHRPAAPAAAPAPPKPAGLNPEQAAAVQSNEAAIAVTAGPGTGKTSTLVARVLHLIQVQGVKPQTITAVTFTNLAAQELRSRIAQALGNRAARGIHAGTFHAVSKGLLPPKSILSREEALLLLPPLLQARGDARTPAQALEEIGRIKNGLLPFPGPDSLYADYQAALARLGARDLDDLLLEALEQDAKGHRPFTHLLVDEVQDINPVQRKLISHWMQPGGTVFLIGDPDQSIYGFRGASAACFDQLAQEIPGLRIYTLRENYRSTPQILEAAQKALQRPCQLQATQPAGCPVRHVLAPTPFAEACWIAEEIGRLTGGLDMLAAGHGSVEQPRAFSDMAILCRTHRQLNVLEACLARQGIPCVVRGREDYLEDPAVQGAIGFFRSLYQPADQAALTACLTHAFQCPPDLLQQAVRIYCPMAQPDPAILTDVFGRSGHLALWVEEMAAYLPRLNRHKPRKLFQDWAKAHGPSPALDRLANLAAFHDTLTDFLDALVQGQEGDLRRPSGKGYASGAVELMTLHGAKGLEFPVIFLAGFHQGSLPLERADGSVDLDEERRLLYVGMTRAREVLLLTGGGAPSPFAEDIAIPYAAIPARERRPEQLSLL